MQSVLKAMLGFLFESPSVTIWRLVLELPEQHWDSILKVALTGFTGNLKCLELLDSALSARVASLCRHILSLSPLCRSVYYAYDGPLGHEGDLVDGHEDPLLQHQMVPADSAGVLEHLSYAQVDDRIPFEWRFAPSFVLGLRCLQIDPVNINDVAIIIKSSNSTQKHSRKSLSGQTTRVPANYFGILQSKSRSLELVWAASSVDAPTSESSISSSQFVGETTRRSDFWTSRRSCTA